MLHTSPNKIHTKPGKTFRSTESTAIKRKHKITKNKLDQKDEDTEAFKEIKAQIKQITENKHFDTSKQTRVRCDASKKGLGACLE